MMKAFVLAIILSVVGLSSADLYMQNLRGNNNRISENNTNRNNANRLFDSQNNGKGGYCWGPAMSFYEGSILSLEWTNQHGCGANPKLFCNMVIQYMCSDADAPLNVLVRDGDGSTTDRIPNDDSRVLDTNNAGIPVYGLNEPRSFYTACENRDRNMGLYIADNNIGRQATRTRQNNNGNRHGFECNEERDYYPYWHPTPWMDIAVLTHDMAWCKFYKDESQNVKPKNFCHTAGADLTRLPYGDTEANNEAQCSGDGHTWAEYPSWDLPAPDCLRAPWSRHNHLGNGHNGFANSYNWSLPMASDANENNPLGCIDNDSCNCVLRMRYNISTGDVGDTDPANPAEKFIDWQSNEGNAPVKNDQTSYQDGLPHSLALNTDQYGRTFQDRSFVFHIKKRPSGVTGLDRIHNLNVRGKRGNIVQTYPATEYDFVPSYLKVRVGDYIHFQWTGCDNNPNGNAGEGTAQTDRSNIVQIRTMGENVPCDEECLEQVDNLFPNQDLRKRMAYLDQTNCLTYEQLKEKHGDNNNEIEQDVQNCAKMNAASEYFDGGLVRVNKTGSFYFMSSRNNNFTNRGQKGAIESNTILELWAIIVVVAGSVAFLGSAGAAGALLYARTHPHTAISQALSKF